MRIKVDPSRCQGHARCVFFAPQVFEIDDEGYALVRPEMELVPAEFEPNVRKAMANCPELAIKLADG